MVTPIKANVIRSARPPQASRKHFAAAGNAQGGFPFRAPKRNSKLFGTCASVYARHNVRSVLDIDWFNNAQTGGSIVKKSKRRSKAVLPALGVTGLSLSLASGATASTGEATVASTSQPHELLLGEEEVFDTSLSTFYTFDKENGGQTSLAQHLKLARGGGCGGCGCGFCCAFTVAPRQVDKGIRSYCTRRCEGEMGVRVNSSLTPLIRLS